MPEEGEGEEEEDNNVEIECVNDETDVDDDVSLGFVTDLVAELQPQVGAIHKAWWLQPGHPGRGFRPDFCISPTSRTSADAPWL